jgi:hypothetical protein
MICWSLFFRPRLNGLSQFDWDRRQFLIAAEMDQRDVDILVVTIMLWFLSILKFFFIMFCGLSIIFINFIWEWFSTDAHWIKSISWFCCRLKFIELETFFCSTLESITIPRNVEILCLSCFSYCCSLSSISFESSSLSRIESAAFAERCLHSVSLPENVVFIAGDPFLHSCEGRISNIDSCQEFNEWKEAHQSGPTEAFERHRWQQP